MRPTTTFRFFASNPKFALGFARSLPFTPMSRVDLSTDPAESTRTRVPTQVPGRRVAGSSATSVEVRGEDIPNFDIFLDCANQGDCSADRTDD